MSPLIRRKVDPNIDDLIHTLDSAMEILSQVREGLMAQAEQADKEQGGHEPKEGLSTKD